MELHFGSGYLYGIGPSGTPVRFGVLDEVDVDFTFTEKPLYGQWVYPVDIGRGSCKVTGKAKSAQISGRQWNDLVFGQALSTPGQLLVTDSEVGSVGSATPYTYTVANAATFSENLGVRYASTGLPLTQVATPSAAGEYSVSSGGVYTFSAGDASASILVSYAYTSTSGNGSNSTVSNVLQGAAPSFGLVANEPYTNDAGVSLQLTINLFKCKSNKLTLPIKQDDYMIEEIDFSAMQNAAGQVFEYSTGEM